MKSSPKYKKFHVFYLMVVMALSAIHPAMADTIKPPDFDQLNARFNSISSDVYLQLAQSRSKSLPKVGTIQQLEFHTRKYLDQGDTINALCLVLHNINLVRNSLDDNSAQFFITLLLDNNQLDTASSLHDIIKRDGEKSQKSNISFLFAKYYFGEHKWQEALAHVNDTYADLTENNANYARLITGVSLQHMKDHRKAIAIYDRIPDTSEYYLYARLNTAVAYIRQGWWTDAQNVIKTALQSAATSGNQTNEEIINRLNLVLGYSLLQKEYYRDAREAFRNVKTGSQYTNRALLGIALASANQEDHIGALNALSALKDRENTDLSVDETYVLLPYMYKKLGQEMTATTSYNEAIKYYQSRLADLDKPYNKKSSGLHALQHNHDDYELVINNNIFEISRELPESFINNPGRISALQKAGSTLSTPKALKSISHLNALQQDYNAAYQKAENRIISRRKDYLNSYLNQSRFGLANLYDNSLSDSP